jgi:hypothetical protein
MAIGSNQFGNQGNRPAGTGSKCLASDCMMWRWDKRDSRRLTERDGYCGLAGMTQEIF